VYRTRLAARHDALTCLSRGTGVQVGAIFDVRALLTPRLRPSAWFGSPREWVFVQKCLLERKCSYLTEKELFSRKAQARAEAIDNPADRIRGFFERFKNRLRLGNLRLIERYVEAEILIRLHFHVADDKFVAYFQGAHDVGGFKKRIDDGDIGDIGSGVRPRWFSSCCARGFLRFEGRFSP
jgi:hypothetical protein